MVVHHHSSIPKWSRTVTGKFSHLNYDMPQTWKIIVIHLYYKPIEPFLGFLVESNDICIASVKYRPQANLLISVQWHFCMFFSRHCLTKQISWKWTLSGSQWLVDTNSREPSKTQPVEWHRRTMIHMMCKATCMNRANTYNYLYIPYLSLSVRVFALLPKSIIGKPELPHSVTKIPAAGQPSTCHSWSEKLAHALIVPS